MDTAKMASPRILSIGWGKMEIETIGKGKDFKLWPGGGRAWDWRESGTQHNPGVQIAEVEDFIVRGCQVVVLTRGVFSRLKVPPETVAFLKENNIEAIVAGTREGVKIYNDYAGKNIPVGGLFHSTC